MAYSAAYTVEVYYNGAMSNLKTKMDAGS